MCDELLRSPMPVLGQVQTWVSAEPEHPTEWCWCQPTVIEVPPDGQIVVHRRWWDQPDV